MNPDRFKKLESGPAPSETEKILSHWARFVRLEITGTEAPPRAEEGNTLCDHCGRGNESAREHCWACFKPLKGPIPVPRSDDTIKIVLNGVPYHSTDPHLPHHVRTLMARIRREGATPETLAQWADQEGKIITSNKNLDRSVLSVRVDGRVYRDGEAAPPHVRELFNHLRQHGVSPALVEGLRAKGHVTVRPPTTAPATDGDIAFWSSVHTAGGGAISQGWWAIFSVGAAIVLYFLYQLLR